MGAYLRLGRVAVNGRGARWVTPMSRSKDDEGMCVFAVELSDLHWGCLSHTTARQRGFGEDPDALIDGCEPSLATSKPEAISCNFSTQSR